MNRYHLLSVKITYRPSYFSCNLRFIPFLLKHALVLYVILFTLWIYIFCLQEIIFQTYFIRKTVIWIITLHLHCIVLSLLKNSQIHYIIFTNTWKKASARTVIVLGSKFCTWMHLFTRMHFDYHQYNIAKC